MLVGTYANTKTILSTMSRRKPSQARLRGLHESDEETGISRSSRGRKSIVSGRVAEGQKLGFNPSGIDLTPCNPSRIYGVVGKLVTPVDCKSAALVHYWFKSSRLHQTFELP